MSKRELEKYVFTSRYAGYKDNLNRRETWYESQNRSRNMMLDKYRDKDVTDLINQAYDAAKRKEVLGSQRALQFGGDPIFKKNARIYNCVSAYADRVKFFQECMYLLLCGCGTGFSVQKHHVAKLPKLIQQKKGTKKFQIPDNIEGWSDAIGVLISSYFDDPNVPFPEYIGKTIRFDSSLIRVAGSRLSSSFGKAPGPEPLIKAIKKIKFVLDSCVKEGLTKLRPIHVYDIVMHFADAVVSGGIRRSATICVFSLEDGEMARAKTGNWFIENPQRGRSNNSALLIRDKTTKQEFYKIIEVVKEFGEPGFVFSNDKELIVNPCVTKDTLVTTKEGVFSVLNLYNQFSTLVNGHAHSSSGFWKTGSQPIYNIELASGRLLKVTSQHKIMNIEKEWIEAKDYNIGDKVKIHNHRGHNQKLYISENKDYAQGYLLGSFIGDGNVTGKGSVELKWWGNLQENYKLDAIELLKMAGWFSKKHRLSENKTSYTVLSSVNIYKFAKEKKCLDDEKHLDVKAMNGNWSYLSGLLSGYFDADGHVIYNKDKGHCIRLTSNNLQNLRNVQIALGAFGVNSKIYQERYPAGFRVMPDGKGGHKEYWCKSTHDLHISCDNIVIFHEMINFRNKAKRDLLDKVVNSYNRKLNRTKFEDKIVNIYITKSENVYDCSVPGPKAFDANGVYVHNCVEISFYCYDEFGNSGWQSCNLSTINCAKLQSEQDFYTACENAAIIGTLQAGFTDFPYLGEVSERIIRREALLGVSMTGIMEKPDISLDPEIQKQGAKIVRDTNRLVAKLIGINQAARTTCIKPEGSSSCVLGTSSGIHAHHAKRYIRRVQANTLDDVYQYFKSINPIACEESVWSANNTDDVISFCIEVSDGSKTKNMMSAVDLLKIVKSTQQNWVTAGRNLSLCTKPWLNNNVSNTISVKKNEWQEVTDYIYNNRKYFCGIALLPFSGDKDYDQAPFTAVHLPTEMISMYGDASMFASGLIDKALDLYEDNLWVACNTLLIEEQKPKGNSKKRWYDRCYKYADKYMEGDIKRLTYCMKDVYNWKLWLDLNRNYKKVNYENLVELENNVAPEQDPACAGGSCSI